MRHIVRTIALLSGFAAVFATAVFAQQVVAWWPDPDSGLMWTNSPAGQRVNHTTAVADCANLRLGGYADWRLPTADEVTAALGTFKEQAYEPYFGGYPQYHEPVPLRGQYNTVVELKFRPNGVLNTWTSTPSGSGGYLLSWFKLGSGHETPSETSTWGSAGAYEAMCVRPMEVETADLAKIAGSSFAVSDVNQLRAEADTVQAVAALVAADYPTALRLAREAVALFPKYLAPWNVMINAHSLSEDWPAVQADMKAAKQQASWSDDAVKKLAARRQRTVTADAAALHFWQLYERGTDAVRRGKDDDALEIADEMQKLQPTWPEALLLRAMALDGMKRWDDSVKTFQQAEKLDKHHETEAKEMRSDEQDRRSANR